MIYQNITTLIHSNMKTNLTKSQQKHVFQQYAVVFIIKSNYEYSFILRWHTVAYCQKSCFYMLLCKFWFKILWINVLEYRLMWLYLKPIYFQTDLRFSHCRHSTACLEDYSDRSTTANTMIAQWFGAMVSSNYRSECRGFESL